MTGGQWSRWETIFDNNLKAFGIHWLVLIVSLPAFLAAWYHWALPLLLIAPIAYTLFARAWLKPIDRFNGLSVILPPVLIVLILVAASFFYGNFEFPGGTPGNDIGFLINYPATLLVTMGTLLLDAVVARLGGSAALTPDAALGGASSMTCWALLVPPLFMYLGIRLRLREQDRGEKA